MELRRKLTRRSFLAQVIGGTAVAGGSLTLMGGRAQAGQVTDHDPTDPSGRGRGGGTGITDSDSGPGADPGGRGRGGGGARQGSGNGGTGVTDSDSGPNSDPWGHGRGGGGGGGSATHQERQESCDRLRQLEAQYRADFNSNTDFRALAELRRIQDAIIQHCS